MKCSNKCLDCGKSISRVSTRCKSCSNKNRKGTYKCNNQNKLEENNPMWKGANVGYNALHSWIIRRKEKPKVCEECKIKPSKDLANISGNYKRDLKDWEWLCRSCHMKKDGRLDLLHKNNRRLFLKRRERNREMPKM